MRVTHLSALSCGTGAANAAQRLHRTLCGLGVTSSMLVAHGNAASPSTTVLNRGFLERQVARFQSYRDRRLLEGIDNDYVRSTGFVGHNIKNIVQREQPSILQLHWIGGEAFRLSSLRGVQIPVVWRMPDMWSFCGTEHLCADPTRYREGYLSTNRPQGQRGRDIDRLVWESKSRTYDSVRKLVFVSPSRWLAKCARESRLLGDRQIEIVPTSCEVDVYLPRDRMMCRTVLGLEPHAPLILTGATCMRTKWKGGDLLIRALNHLAERRAFQANVVCFGQGTEAFRQQCKLPVISMGSIADSRLMSILYSAADVFVAPSRMENLANTVLESMACGTPTVAFDIGGMPDMIEHRVNGYLAAPFETEDLAEGIRWLIEDSDVSATSAAARKRILANHLPETEARAYLRIYESLLTQDIRS